MGRDGVRVSRADDGPEHLTVTVYGRRAELGRGAEHFFARREQEHDALVPAR
ncbi:hypothetical protein Plo01_80010 [Planobispora longispora]|uniref:Uncharacterized protein n=1 Tax=Planobispora longispora TaxID=28887 RepID=A0A8J3WA95_9ACTN|nr:hypothetical protein Plo01_80010 [Planobispora longispora]